MKKTNASAGTRNSRMIKPPTKIISSQLTQKRNAVVGLHGVVGQHIAQQVAAIERRNRQQVEDRTERG